MAIQFPNNPGIGSVFTDTDAGFSYEWTGVVWKSFTPAAANNIKELDDISSGFDNSTTTFNLTILSEAYQPVNAAMLQISLGGVIQEPGTDYTVSFTDATITFTTAPNAGLDFFGVVRGTAVAIDYATDGNVQTKQEFTATEGQTSFTVSGGYTAGYIDVFRNGVRLGSDDITDTSGTAVVLTVPAQAGDLIETVKYNVASLVTTAGQFVNLNVTGIVTAGSFEGDGSGLTGVASTDNIQTATAAKFLSDVSISGVTTVGVVTGGTSVSASHFYGDGSALTGIDATSIKDSGGNVKAQANPNGIVVTGVLTATTGSFSGNVSIGGTLSYLDVTNIDSVGIITAQQGIQVLANGVDVTGIGTFEDRLTYDGSLGQAGGGTVTYTVTVATKDSTHRYNGSGSSNGYVIDNLQAPVLTFTPGRTYRFTNDNTGSHPLKFYLEADKTTLYSTGVTFNDAYTEITVSDTTPAVLHYQCTAHSLMGNSVITQSNIAAGFNVVDESSDTSCNVLFTTDATGTGLEAKTGTNLTFNSSSGQLTATSFSGDGSSLTGVDAGISAGKAVALSSFLN